MYSAFSSSFCVYSDRTDHSVRLQSPTFAIGQNPCQSNWIPFPLNLTYLYNRYLYPVVSYPVLPYPIMSYRISSRPILSNPILSYSVLSQLILSNPVLSFSILSYRIPFLNHHDFRSQDLFILNM